ncbi:MAG: GNAT family protein [Bacillota bacterium]
MIKFETDRLIIRDHIASDLADYHRWISDAELMEFVIFGKSASVEQSIILFAEALAGQFDSNRTKYFLTALEKSSGRIIGDCGITVIEKQVNGGIGEIGYILLKEFWGHGYAAEIARRLIDYCFTELKLHKIVAHCDSENTASEQVMLRCGMVKEGAIKNCRYMNGIWKDELQYTVINENNL